MFMNYSELFLNQFQKFVFIGTMCHADLVEKLKLLYKVHVLPGKNIVSV